jgi:lipoic acid synthetase
MSARPNGWRNWMHGCVRYNEGMADLKGIPVVAEGALTRSGEKYLTPQGFTAIRDGIKRGAAPPPATGAKPPWLKARAPSGPGYGAVRALVR